MIKARYFGNLAHKTKVKEEFFNVENISELLTEIKKKYGKEIHGIAKSSYIIVNEENAANLKGYKTKLVSGDVVRLLPICGGG